MEKIYIDTSWESEICCEVCNDVIHNHFDCPCCKKERASTSIYGDAELNEEFECEECGSKFKYLGMEGWDYKIQILEDKLDNTTLNSVYLLYEI